MATDDAAEAVKEAGRRWWEAAVAGDPAVIDELFAEEVIYFHSGAQRDTKSGYRDRIASGTYADLKIDYSPEQVLVLGDVALVAAKLVSSGRVSGYEHGAVTVMALSVWSHRDGRWQLVGHSMTPVKEASELYPTATSD